MAHFIFRWDQSLKLQSECKDRSLYKCFKYLLTKLSNNIDVFVIFKWSLTLAIPQICKDRSLYKCFKYLLTKLSNNIDVFVIFKWSLTLAIFETIVETTQAIL